MRSHELETLGGIESVSRANQAAAFPKISRSIFSCLISLRRRESSSRSALVKPSARRPTSRSACLTQFRTVCAESLKISGLEALSILSSQLTRLLQIFKLRSAAIVPIENPPRRAGLILTGECDNRTYTPVPTLQLPLENRRLARSNLSQKNHIGPPGLEALFDREV